MPIMVMPMPMVMPMMMPLLTWCRFRVRDEFRLTLHAAETLYESSIAFGNRYI